MACSKMGKLAMVGAATGGAFLGWKFLKNADLQKRNESLQQGQRIVILGAGFGGMNVAQELSKLLPDHRDAEITVIDHNNFLLFTPMLAEVAGGQLDARHIVAPPRQLSKRIQFRQGKVTGIDLHNRSVVLDTGDGESSTCTVNADHVVIALGSVPKFHGIPGVQEHSLPIKSIGDAAAIRNQALTCLERASWESNPEIRREILTFVVGGGGYTGVEIMAAINDLLRDTVHHYPTVRPEEIRTVIAEPGDRLLAELSPDLARFAQQKPQDVEWRSS
jgi:NADH:ubiquinone reductase (H+-translocating)